MTAYVIMCNDSPEYVVVGTNEQKVEEIMARLRDEDAKQQPWHYTNDVFAGRTDYRMFWHCYKIEGEIL